MERDLDKIKQIQVADLECFVRGDCLSLGPQAAVIYFALHGMQSLSMDPINQPVQYLRNYKVRCFSFSLPMHDMDTSPDQAIEKWLRSYEENPSFLAPFFEKVKTSIEQLVKEEILIPEKTCLMGLSRGAFAAAHIASLLPKIPFLLAFAPMTSIRKASSSQANPQACENSSIKKLAEKLCSKHIRIHIGNNDLRVGTDACYDFYSTLVKEAQKKQIKNIPLELQIQASIGRHGHGSSPSTFQAGITWIQKKLELEQRA